MSAKGKETNGIGSRGGRSAMFGMCDSEMSLRGFAGWEGGLMVEIDFVV
jgi:hypothetical protein